ncbi:hypothetical protein AURDEDRAFT_72911 [Auricularia subglabra TFB-10046 SS5]|uniref:Uncharacterized protein n=1 Tax=Auricularia subglabra (strain TFB-10046 / SS5) TaxID=717982 RepID=J0LHU4_AURST|nr:hypothetical protein AURDEDRAFT_72911 [Auricularia subglabra TFB-10046 SS5]
MCQFLAIWLFLCAGLSRETSNRVLRALRVILSAMLSLMMLVITVSLPQFTGLSFDLPGDIRTVLKSLELEPQIERTVCCPKCFSSYAPDDIPERCTWKEVPRARACGERLLMQRQTRQGPKLVPRSLFSRQSFDSWLQFFLSRPDTERLIDESYAYQPHADKMNGIWDSPSWRSLFTFTTTAGCLTFCLYIDWFNPLTNKIAGKKISYGAIILCCMNLPPELRHLPENVYFAGIIPGPKEPSIVTMTHVLELLVKDLLPYWVGKDVCTFRFPAGRRIRVALIPLIADLLAIRKMSGFGAHSCTYFCSYCLCTIDDIESLDIGSWTLRNSNTVKAQAQAWRDERTKKNRKARFRESGVRWSPLHELPYWDPVKHLVLGYMHNTLEGILQHHARTKWGIGAKFRRFSLVVDDTSTLRGDDEISAQEMAQEVQALTDESSEHDDVPAQPIRARSQVPLPVQDSMDVDEDENDPDYRPPADSDDGSDEEDPQPLEDPAPGGCIFSSAQLELIRTCFRDASMPTYMERPPSNFGEAAHGRLKAITWLVIFTNFLPLVIPELWASGGENDEPELLENFFDLVISTNIISSYSYAPGDSTRYRTHYIRYRKSTQLLFPRSSSVPNHHYAMHNPELMEFWGPLPLLSEFPFEQKNGAFQKVKTNRHIYEMDYTMLHRTCSRGRLNALLHAQDPDPARLYEDGAELNDSEQADFLADSPALSNVDYDRLLAHINLGGTIWRHYAHHPHPGGVLIFPPRAQSLKTLEHRGRNFSVRDAHEGNSAILFRDPAHGGQLATGFIVSMWTVLLPPKLHTMILVELHKSPLDVGDARRGPYHGQDVQSKIMSTSPGEHLLIRPDDVLGQCVVWRRPAGIYGMSEDFFVVNYACYRGRTLH